MGLGLGLGPALGFRVKYTATVLSKPLGQGAHTAHTLVEQQWESPSEYLVSGKSHPYCYNIRIMRNHGWRLCEGRAAVSVVQKCGKKLPLLLHLAWPWLTTNASTEPRRYLRALCPRAVWVWACDGRSALHGDHGAEFENAQT